MTRTAYAVTVATLIIVTVPLWGATFYVDATGGLDANDGLSPATAWKTIAKVNGSTFAAGDQILFKRGEVWRESLVAPSSGTSGNPIVFDAYGTGEAPTITGALDLPSSAWTQDSTYIWRATVTATGMNYVSFGGIWGTKHTGSKTECTAARDFFFMSNVLYVYAVGNPASYYGNVAAMLMTTGQLIYINGKTWLTLQHFRLTYFDGYGLRIGGASDHITVANLYADGIIPAGTQPHGFYVNASPSPTDINFYNDEGLFGNRTGEEKKESALSFVAAALQLSEAVAAREIVDEEKFKSGLSKVVDGTVECLNASSWAKKH